MFLFPKKTYFICLIYFITTTNAFAAVISVMPSNTTITLSAGTFYSFTVSGGTGYYKITSSDNSVATTSLTGLNSSDCKIEGISNGIATLTVEDSAGDQIFIDVIVASSTLGLSQSQLSLAPQSSQTITVSSGSGYYKIASSDDTVAVATVTNNIITVSAVSVGSATITITDSNSQTATIDVQVMTGSKFTVSPSKITLGSTGDTATCTLSDTSLFYQVSSSDSSIATAMIFNNVVTIVAGAPGVAVITVNSSNAQTAVIDVTVSNKNIITLFPGQTNDWDMTATGGNGFYQATISDNTIANISFSGNNAKITGLYPGTTQIFITDSVSNTFTLNINVSLEPPLLNVAIKGDNVTLSWNEISGADSYIIYYAPNDTSGAPITSKIQFVNVGKILSLDITLYSGASYSAAVQAVHPQIVNLSSPASNIESITIQQ